ncbi:hypothetical protein [Achromobacter ruhlandii]|uniref:hypothetical protein n=1 Tax=Achromobacter ruhlandii TaxID=72557 RepID=UPI0007BF96EF|nr:hypothetical protein [Achromobacter ruhlandii]
MDDHTRNSATTKPSWRCVAATAAFLVFGVVAIFGAIFGIGQLRSANPDLAIWESMDGAIVVFFAFLALATVYAAIWSSGRK